MGMEWIVFDKCDKSTYPPIETPILITFFDREWKVGLAQLLYREKYGGYYWWGEYGFGGMSVLEPTYDYEPWLDVSAWMSMPKAYW